MSLPRADPGGPAPAGDTPTPLEVSARFGPVPCLRVGSGGPPVVLVADVLGVTPFARQLAMRLARSGFTVLLPDYMHSAGPAGGPSLEHARARRRRLDEHRVLEELHDVVGLARGSSREVGVVGVSLGGTLALHLAKDSTRLPTVCFYGFPGPSPRAGPGGVTPPLERGGVFRSPVLGIWGDGDVGVGRHHVEALRERTVPGSVPVEVVVHPGVGHGFLRSLGRPEHGHPARVAASSWRAAEAFLQRMLGARAPARLAVPASPGGAP